MTRNITFTTSSKSDLANGDQVSSAPTAPYIAELVRFAREVEADENLHTWHPQTVWPQAESDYDRPREWGTPKVHCTCDHDKLNCPLHGLEGSEPLYEHVYDLTDHLTPKGIDDEQPRSWLEAKTAADEWDTREYNDRMQMPPTMEEAPQGKPHVDPYKHCTCEEDKLNCPIHGMNPELEDPELSWSIPENTPVGYPDNQPRNYTHPPQTASVREAAETAAQRLRRQGLLEQELGPDQAKVVHEWPNGWKMHEIDNYADMEREGQMMGNCFGLRSSSSPHGVWEHHPEIGMNRDEDGFTYVDPHSEVNYNIPLPKAYQGWFYSLRDPQGLPHVSGDLEKEEADPLAFHVHPDEGAWLARHNTRPKPEQIALIEDWLVKEYGRTSTVKTPFPEDPEQNEEYEFKTVPSAPNPEPRTYRDEYGQLHWVDGGALVRWSKKTPKAKLWLDDTRRPPSSDWDWARNVAEAQHLLQEENRVYDHMSLDHDLGMVLYKGKAVNDPDALSGGDFILWLH